MSRALRGRRFGLVAGVTLLCAAAPLGIVTTSAAAQANGQIVVSATRIGRLVLGRSSMAAVVARYGPTKVTARDFLGYDCTILAARHVASCKINFFFSSTDRLMASYIGAPNPRYETAWGAKLGMPIAQLHTLADPGSPAIECGEGALTYSKPAGAAGPLAGLTILITKGRASALVVVSPRDHASCLHSGGLDLF
jgi:hypothetical protein